jgi:hypothetical protein
MFAGDGAAQDYHLPEQFLDHLRKLFVPILVRDIFLDYVAMDIAVAGVPVGDGQYPVLIRDGGDLFPFPPAPAVWRGGPPYPLPCI